MKIALILTNSVHPDEMPHTAAFHQGLQCLPNTHLEIKIQWVKKHIDFPTAVRHMTQKR